MQLQNNKILVTGGASGIGFAMAERFVSLGNTVIVCGRRDAALRQAAEKIPGLIIKKIDLQAADGRESLYQWISEEHPDLNVLVNNAGIQQWMKLSDPDYYQRAMEEIRTNIEAPVHLTSLFLGLKSLTTIMNVASGLSFVPFSKTPVYAATKAFIHSYTQSLAILLKPRNVEVIEIVPPALNTDLGGKGIHDHAPPVSGFIDSIFEQLKAGKTQLTYGFTESVCQAGQDVFQPIIARLNELPA